MKNLIKTFLKNYYQRIFLKKAIEKIKKYKTRSLSDLVDFCFKFHYGINLKYLSLSITPAQIKEEILKLIKLLKKRKIKNLLEIGTADGGTLFLFSKIVEDNGKIITIDLPNGYPRWREILYKSFSEKNKKIFIIKSDSHDIKTYESVKKILNGEKLDFVFIDGDHSYKSVKKDFETYVKLVKKGGLVAFHDIVKDERNYSGEVYKFWEKIKKRYKNFEIVKNKNQNGYGIGVIYV